MPKKRPENAFLSQIMNDSKIVQKNNYEIGYFMIYDVFQSWDVLIEKVFQQTVLRVYVVSLIPRGF